MLKRTVLCVIAVLAFGFANAQDVKFGVKGGANISNWTGKDTKGASAQYKFGFNIGGFAEIKISDQFAIQPEILYSTQGRKSVNGWYYLDGKYTQSEVKCDLSYINIPVMFKYYAESKFNLEAGPQIGFLTSAEVSTRVNEFNRTIKQDAKGTFESVDFSLNFGLGYDFTDQMAVGFRYNLGLSNILKGDANADAKIHNTVFSLSMAYKF
jgi:opacity protein-like surface antigen